MAREKYEKLVDTLGGVRFMLGGETFCRVGIQREACLAGKHGARLSEVLLLLEEHREADDSSVDEETSNN